MKSAIFTRRETNASTDSGFESTNNGTVKSEELNKDPPVEDVAEKNILLNTVKKQVKLLMEEFVSRKYVHEYSSNVISLCATIESCLLLGLKRRSLGLFKQSSSLALLEKIAKQNQSAKVVCIRMAEERHLPYDSAICNSELSSNASVSSRSDVSNSSSSVFGHSWSASSFLGLESSKNTSSENELSSLHAQNLKKHLWIRLALTEKVLDKIIDYLVKNSNRFYSKDSIIGDPCDGYILVSLLSGPCSLEYSRMRQYPQLILEDPDAGELIQRQRIQNQTGSTGIEAGRSPSMLHHAVSTSALFWNSGSTQNLNKPTLATRQLKVQSLDPDAAGIRSPGAPARRYIESLHQTSNDSLLFGKNNVYSQPRENLPKMAGYLSLHQAVSEILIKWTPNVLMSGGLSNNNNNHHTKNPVIPKIEWDCAIIIWLAKIVNIHCHRQERGDSLILVNRDGSQNPPFEFPPGGHLISFLSCLETGLSPRYRLDPPLWSKVCKEHFLSKYDIDESMITCNDEGPKSADNIKRRSIFMWSSGNASASNLATTSSLSFSWSSSSFSWMQPSYFRKLRLGNKKLISDHADDSCSDIGVNGDSHMSDAESVTTIMTGSETEDDSATHNEDWHTDMIFKIMRIHKQFYSHNTSSTDLLNDQKDIDEDRDDCKEEEEEEDMGVTKGDSLGNDEELSGNITEEVYSPTIVHMPSWCSHLGNQTNKSISQSERNLRKHNKSSIKKLCSSMKKEILARSFYGWLAYCRHMRTIRCHLSQLVMPVSISYKKSDYVAGVDQQMWNEFINLSNEKLDKQEILRYIYWGGCCSGIRREVWPFLLGVFDWTNNNMERRTILRQWERRYDLAVSEWMIVEAVLQDVNENGVSNAPRMDVHMDAGEIEEPAALEIERDSEKCEEEQDILQRLCPTHKEEWQQNKTIVISTSNLKKLEKNLNRIQKDVSRCDRHFTFFGLTADGEANLQILNRLMCAWVWEHLEIGYIQGMCDILAPILVIYNGASSRDNKVLSNYNCCGEELIYACFSKMMERMLVNFPVNDSNKMDLTFSRMRSAVNILDSELLEHMHSHGDFTHFYFSYRWFLLDFKREFSYDDIFCLWEVIWSAENTCCPNFSLFVGLALLLSYRDVIIDNDMEFTDIIRFFNEMAEKHKIDNILNLSRELVEKLQILLHS